MLKFFSALRLRQFLALLFSVCVLVIVLDEIEAPLTNATIVQVAPKLTYLRAVEVQSVKEMPKLQALALVEPVKALQIIAQVSGQVLSVADEFQRGKLLPGEQQLMSIDPLRAQVAAAQAQAD